MSNKKKREKLSTIIEQRKNGGRPAETQMDGIVETATNNQSIKEVTTMENTTKVNGATTNTTTEEATTMNKTNEAVNGVIEECYAKATKVQTAEEKIADLVNDLNGTEAGVASQAQKEVAEANIEEAFKFICENGTQAQADYVQEAMFTGDYEKIQAALRTVVNNIINSAPAQAKPSLMAAAMAIVTPIFKLTQKAIKFSWNTLTGIGKAVFNVLKWTFTHVKDLVFGLGVFGKDVFMEIGVATMDIVKFAFGRYQVAGQNIATSFKENVTPPAVAFGADMSQATSQLMEDLSIKINNYSATQA